MPQVVVDQGELEQRLQAAYAQGQQEAAAGAQGGQPQKAAKPKGLAGIVYTLAAPIRGAIKAKDSLDGFVGSFIRSSATSYSLSTAIPLLIANPLLGALYTAVTVPFTYFASKATYNISKGTLGLLFYPVAHPIETLKFGYNMFFILHPIATVKYVWDLGKKNLTTKKLFKTGKTSKLGRTLGGLFGMGRGLFYTIPDVSQSLTSAIGGKLAPVLDRAGDGLSSAAGGLSKYWSAFQVKEPLAPAFAFAGSAASKVQMAEPLSSAYDVASSYWHKLFH